MTDREIIIHLATAAGWKVFDKDAPDADRPGCDSGPIPCLVENRSGNWFGLFKTGQWTTLNNPVDNLLFVFEVQAALKYGNFMCYMDALLKQYQAYTEDCSWDVYLICASARQRCLAMVEATR